MVGLTYKDVEIVHGRKRDYHKKYRQQIIEIVNSVLGKQGLSSASVETIQCHLHWFHDIIEVRVNLKEDRQYFELAVTEEDLIAVQNENVECNIDMFDISEKINADNYWELKLKDIGDMTLQRI